jgi:capsular exopolysaccharide synthesis family protein
MIKRNIVTIYDPKSPVSETYRTLRTNIQFSSLDKKTQTIMITSSGPGEGKSTISANLASVMAQSGNKTLLIDCDLRKPNIHKMFGLSNVNGLSNLLVEEIEIEKAVQHGPIENLNILTSGTMPPNPAELLGSEKMKNFINSLRKYFDYIILDTPPVVVVTDAQLISRISDGCLLVVSSRQVERDAAVKAKELLLKVNAKIIGVVLNKVEKGAKGGYKYYYHYYYGSDGERKKVSKRMAVK